MPTAPTNLGGRWNRVAKHPSRTLKIWKSFNTDFTHIVIHIIIEICLWSHVCHLWPIGDFWPLSHCWIHFIWTYDGFIAIKQSEIGAQAGLPHFGHQATLRRSGSAYQYCTIYRLPNKDWQKIQVLTSEFRIKQNSMRWRWSLEKKHDVIYIILL